MTLLWEPFHESKSLLKVQRTDLKLFVEPGDRLEVVLAMVVKLFVPIALRA